MVSLRINGEVRDVDAPPDMPLLWVLRDILGMTGTKFGCGIAAMRRLHRARGWQPGALLPPRRGLDRPTGRHHHRRHCRLPVGAKVQKAWLDLEVIQCGYCQSGQIMSATALLNATPHPEDSDIDAAMAGNICRCGTYQRIRAAIKQAAQA